MTTEHSTYTYETGEQETVTLRRGPITPHGHALLKIEYSDGQTADCYVNTAWLRNRLNDLGEPCPSGAEGMNNHTACEDTLSLVQQQRDQAIGRVNALSDENDDLRTRAEKAERERDEALAGVRVLTRENIECHERFRATESRPLTPDAMTAREHIDAAWEAAHIPTDGMIPAETEYIVRFSPGTYGVRKSGLEPIRAESVYARRLLDPPRPEGAEELQRAMADLEMDDPAGFADLLAERGIRFGGEEANR